MTATGCSGGARAQSSLASKATNALETVDGLTISDEVTVAAPIYQADSPNPSRPSFGLDSYLVTTVADLGYQTPSTAAYYGMAPVAVRVAQDGSVVDPFGILLSSSDQLADAVGTAFDGSNWLSFWTDPRAGELLCARVSPDGTVLDPDGIVVASQYGSGSGPKIPRPPVFDGNQVLLLADNFVFADRNCHFVSAAPNPIWSSTLGVVFDGQNYRVLYTDPTNTATSSYSIYLQAFSTAGAAVGGVLTVDSIPRPARTTTRWVVGDLAVHAGTIGVLYGFGEYPDPCAGFPSPCGTNPPPAQQVRFRSVSADGTLGTVRSYPIHVQPVPAVTAVNDGFLVTDTFSVEHLATDGTLLASSTQSTPSVLASDGTKVLFVSTGGTSTVDLNLNAATGAPLLKIAAQQQTTSVAATTDTALVAFASTATLDSRAVRFAKSGELLDTNPLVLEHNANEPSLASDGTEFLAAWSNPAPKIDARLISSGGELGPIFQLGTTGDMFTPRNSPKVASNSVDFFVTWFQLSALVGARVSAGGSVLDATPIPLLDGFGGTPGSAVAFDGERYVVAVGDESMGSHLAGPIQLAFVTPSTGAVETVTTPWTGTVNGIAWADDRGLLLWSGSGALTASRLDRAGPATDGLSVSLLSSVVDPFQAQIVWNGSVYLVARSNLTQGDAWLARVTSDGTLLDPAGIPLADGYPIPPTEYFSLASFSGDSLVAYGRLDSTLAFRSFQARARFLRGSGLPSGTGGAGAGGTGAAGAGTGVGGLGAGNGQGGLGGNDSNPAGGGAGSAGTIAAGGGADAGAAGVDGDGAGASNSAGTGGSDVAGTGGRGGGVSIAAGNGNGGAAALNGDAGGSSTAPGGHGGNGDAGAANGGYGGASAGHAGQAVAGSKDNGQAGGAGTLQPPRSESGCGCRVATHHSDAPSPALALLGFFALRRRRTPARRAA
jgi:MYXO-CTERM domain-containing protein